VRTDGGGTGATIDRMNARGTRSPRRNRDFIS